MKKMFFAALVVLFASCSSDDDDSKNDKTCTCYRQFYQFGTKTDRTFYSDNCFDDGRVLGDTNNLRIIVECE